MALTKNIASVQEHEVKAESELEDSARPEIVKPNEK